ncbi:MAG: hypothetical protein GY772_06920 [bacterium]|nr:hypothetical protein [bacterium]
MSGNEEVQDPRFHARSLGDLLPALAAAGLRVDLHGEVPLPGADQRHHPFAGETLSDDEWDAVLWLNEELATWAFYGLGTGAAPSELAAELANGTAIPNVAVGTCTEDRS